MVDMLKQKVRQLKGLELQPNLILKCPQSRERTQFAGSLPHFFHHTLNAALIC